MVKIEFEYVENEEEGFKILLFKNEFHNGEICECLK